MLVLCPVLPAPWDSPVTPVTWSQTHLVLGFCDLYFFIDTKDNSSSSRLGNDSGNSVQHDLTFTLLPRSSYPPTLVWGGAPLLLVGGVRTVWPNPRVKLKRYLMRVTTLPTCRPLLLDLSIDMPVNQRKIWIYPSVHLSSPLSSRHWLWSFPEAVRRWNESWISVCLVKVIEWERPARPFCGEPSSPCLPDEEILHKWLYFIMSLRRSD